MLIVYIFYFGCHFIAALATVQGASIY